MLMSNSACSINLALNFVDVPLYTFDNLLMRRAAGQVRYTFNIRRCVGAVLSDHSSRAFSELTSLRLLNSRTNLIVIRYIVVYRVDQIIDVRGCGRCHTGCIDLSEPPR